MCRLKNVVIFFQTIPKYINDNIEIFSDSDKESSDEENFNEKTYSEENSSDENSVQEN